MPLSASFHTIPRKLIRSTTPVKLSSAPMGSCRGTALLPSISRTCFTTIRKSEPARSILFRSEIEQVNHAGKVVFGANGKLQGYGIAAEHIANLLYHHQEV